MLIESGNKTRTDRTTHAVLNEILHVKCSGDYVLYVFEGCKGQHPDLDICIMYTSPHNSSRRTPKHILWTIDILLKREHQKRLTCDFLYRIKAYWDSCKELNSRDFNAIKSLVDSLSVDSVSTNYSKLASYGEYPPDFLYLLLCLLAVQEKTGMDGAFRFGGVVDALLKSDLDLYSVVAAAEQWRK